MLYFADAKLLIYAPPKTGTTALHQALGDHADLALRRSMKHLSVKAAHKHVLPLIAAFKHEPPEGFAIVREPIDWLHSWYRYRTRLDISDPKSTTHVDFDGFVDGYLADERPDFAKVGQQSRHLAGSGAMAPVHLFAHDHMDRAVGFLTERLGIEFALDWLNESPEMDLHLSAEHRRRLETKFAPDYDLYEKSVSYSLGFEPPR